MPDYTGQQVWVCLGSLHQLAVAAVGEEKLHLPAMLLDLGRVFP